MERTTRPHSPERSADMRKRKQAASVDSEEKGLFFAPKKSRFNQSQQRAWELLQSFSVVILAGPAGCGKTHVAVEYAATAVRDKRFEKIVFVRSPMEMGRSRLGFTPGTVAEKMAPYTAPIFAIAKKFGVKPEDIECHPLGFVQGMTFEDSIVIVDEVQNFDIEEFRAIVTRLGRGSQMILAGDPQQDTRHVGGFDVFLDKVKSLASVGIQHFTDADNMRHPVIIEVLNALKDL